VLLLDDIDALLPAVSGQAQSATEERAEVLAEVLMDTLRELEGYGALREVSLVATARDSQASKKELLNRYHCAQEPTPKSFHSIQNYLNPNPDPELL